MEKYYNELIKRWVLSPPLVYNEVTICQSFQSPNHLNLNIITDDENPNCTAGGWVSDALIVIITELFNDNGQSVGVNAVEAIHHILLVSISERVPLVIIPLISNTPRSDAKDVETCGNRGYLKGYLLKDYKKPPSGEQRWRFCRIFAPDG